MLIGLVESSDSKKNMHMARVAEFLGTLFLTLTVVGSGIMAENLTDDVALQLLINAAATVVTLYILINLIAPISGAHFNPVVTMVATIRGSLKLGGAALYLMAQISGAIIGTGLAHFLFERDLFERSTTLRDGSNLFLSEIIATFGLVMIAFAGWFKIKSRQRATLISLWIGSAYFFTSSTSFANPAVTVGRAFTDTFSGIAPSSVLPFIAAQIIGALLAVALLSKSNKVDLNQSQPVKE